MFHFSSSRYLQVLIQELGVNLDMSFLMALLSLLSQVPSTATEVLAYLPW